jgi:hypothetical protein
MSVSKLKEKTLRYWQKLPDTPSGALLNSIIRILSAPLFLSLELVSLWQRLVEDEYLNSQSGRHQIIRQITRSLTSKGFLESVLVQMPALPPLRGPAVHQQLPRYTSIGSRNAGGCRRLCSWRESSTLSAWSL